MTVLDVVGDLASRLMCPLLWWNVAWPSGWVPRDCSGLVRSGGRRRVCEDVLQPQALLSPCTWTYWIIVAQMTQRVMSLHERVFFIAHISSWRKKKTGEFDQPAVTLLWHTVRHFSCWTEGWGNTAPPHKEWNRRWGRKGVSQYRKLGSVLPKWDFPLTVPKCASNWERRLGPPTISLNKCLLVSKRFILFLSIQSTLGKICNALFILFFFKKTKHQPPNTEKINVAQ